MEAIHADPEMDHAGCTFSEGQSFDSSSEDRDPDPKIEIQNHLLEVTKFM